MKTKELTIQDYKSMLDKHDWYYMMSEDANVYKKGSYSYAKVKELSYISDKHKELFKQYQDKHKIS
jgi:hypothetical protein